MSTPRSYVVYSMTGCLKGEGSKMDMSYDQCGVHFIDALLYWRISYIMMYLVKSSKFWSNILGTEGNISYKKL